MICCKQEAYWLLQAGSVSTPIDQWCWATQVTDSLLALKAHAEQAWAGGGRPDSDIINRHTRLILDAARIAADDHTSPGQLAKKHRARLAVWLLSDDEAHDPAPLGDATVTDEAELLKEALGTGVQVGASLGGHARPSAQDRQQ